MSFEITINFIKVSEQWKAEPNACTFIGPKGTGLTKSIMSIFVPLSEKWNWTYVVNINTVSLVLYANLYQEIWNLHLIFKKIGVKYYSNTEDQNKVEQGFVHPKWSGGIIGSSRWLNYCRCVEWMKRGVFKINLRSSFRAVEICKYTVASIYIAIQFPSAICKSEIPASSRIIVGRSTF